MTDKKNTRTKYKEAISHINVVNTHKMRRESLSCKRHQSRKFCKGLMNIL